MCTVALFTTVKLWSQFRGPSTKEENVVHIHNGVLSCKKKEIMIICRKQGGTRNHHIKQNKPDIVGVLSYEESKFNHTQYMCINTQIHIQRK